MTNNDLNEKTGNRILQSLEEKSKLTLLELDKYKLLVSETDVIMNLLLKLCNKLANTENLIQLKQIQLTTKSNDNETIDNKKFSSNEDIVSFFLENIFTH